MACAKCLTKQRDQTLMLRAWLRFHAHLVGFPNLVIHDEGSTDPKTIELLRRAELAGAHIGRHDAGGIDLQKQAELLAASAGEGVELVVPLSLDEFLAVYTAHGISCRRDHVLAALDALRGERRVIATSPGLVSVAGHPCEFALALPPRLILPTGVSDEGECTTLLTCIRCANIPADAQARIVFQGFGNLIDALGIRHEMFGAPVPSPRSAPADAVWVRDKPGQEAVRIGHDLPSSDWPPLVRHVLAGAGEGLD